MTSSDFLTDDGSGCGEDNELDGEKDCGLY